jgi:probable phosphoglycerate mutase
VHIDRAVASPLVRAQLTAVLALGERSSMLQLDEGLREIGHGDWEGLLSSEIGERDGHRLQAWREAPETVMMPGPGGESLRQVAERAWAAFARACDGLHADETVLVVAHDAVNRVLLCRVLGLPLSRLWAFRQAPTTLNLLEGLNVDTLELVRLNDCQHHTPLFGEAVHRAL